MPTTMSQQPAHLAPLMLSSIVRIPIALVAFESNPTDERCALTMRRLSQLTRLAPRKFGAGEHLYEEPPLCPTAYNTETQEVVPLRPGREVEDWASLPRRNG